MPNSKNITFDQLQSALTRVKNSLDKKANTSHGNHVPKTETANNARFLRNDNTWQTITPVNIGAADRSHNHTFLTGVTSLQFAAASSDHATIKVTTDGGSAANTYLDFEMDDDTGSDMFRWRFNAWDSSASASTGQFNLMTLSAKDTTSARLTVNGDVTASSFTGNASSATKLQTARAIKIGNTSRNFDGNANVTWTLADIGAAPSSHGTHVTWSTTTPKANGTAAVGTETKVARGDHVHPLQTNVSGSSGSCTGNAATATKLKTARNIALTGTITGNANFDGSGNISIATSVNSVPASGSWFKGIPTVTSAGVMEVGKYIDFHNAADGTTDYDVRLQCNGTSANTVNMPTNSGTLALLSDNVTSATRLQTARKLTIGNTGKTFNGTADVAWTLADIGAAASNHTHSYIPLSGSASITGDLEFTNYSGTATRGVIGKIGDNDYWRIAGGATASNAGYLEIATADDANEPIYVRQYGSGKFGTLTRTATLLDGSGNTSFPGTVTAPTFAGALNGNAATATSASKLTTARNIGKASFNGTNDIYLSDIMGRADTSSSANQYRNQYTKFARIDVSDRTYNACVGKISFINTEANAAKGILEFYIRTQDTIADSYIELCWSSLTDKKYADSVSAVKVSDGVFDLYYQPKNDWNTAKFTIIDCHKPKKITLYSDQEYVSSITPVCTSSLNAQYVDDIYTDYVSNRVLTLTTDKYQYAAITSNNTIINLPSVSSFTEIHLFFDWPSGISIIMPSNVKWQEGVMYGPGHTHEFIFTYVNSDIGWLGGCVVYG